MLLAGAVLATGTSQFSLGPAQTGKYAGNLSTVFEIEKPHLAGLGNYASYPITFNSTAAYFLNMTVNASNQGWFAYWMNASQYAEFTSPSTPSTASLWSALGYAQEPNFPQYLGIRGGVGSGSPSSWYGPGTFYLVFASTAIHGVNLTIKLSVCVP